MNLDIDTKSTKVDWTNVFSLFGVIALIISVIGIGVLSNSANYSNTSNAAAPSINWSSGGIGGNPDLHTSPLPPKRYQYVFDVHNNYREVALEWHVISLSGTNLNPNQWSLVYSFRNCGGPNDSPLYGTATARFGDGSEYQGSVTINCVDSQYPNHVYIDANQPPVYTCDGTCIPSSTQCSYGSGNGTCASGFHCCSNTAPSPTPSCRYIGQACSAECIYPNHCTNGYCCGGNSPDSSGTSTGSVSY